ncbi:MAG: aminotransferase class I/II-fold pyridoxal phosphate-dependent enzyme, partial [Moraxellaceae bacterium]|nr:aminotransferase class I/II-fold pyridoxal phosphate-dependent enzyme [Moraxellaceae bacterium]
MPVQHQIASTKVWQDEAHVSDNRALYREKFDRVYAVLNDVLPLTRPEAGFYFWAATPVADDVFAQKLHEHTGVTVLPGRYLGRDDPAGVNPGAGYVRMALVANIDECVEAAERIRDFLKSQPF